MTEKILILGGNKAQVPLIEASKREGYHVVLCDYTSTNPGIALSDTHYQENFMNREEVLRIAEKEHINGIISNSEAAMPVVAYVSEKLNLTGNTLEAITNITSKKNFRDLQHRLNIFSPECETTSSFEEALIKSQGLTFPIIMKPDKSSGSRGTTRIDSYPYMKNQYDNWKACSEYSLNSNVVLENFIAVPSLSNIIDGDIFVHDDIFIWDGLFTSKRSKLAPMIPMTQTYPAVLSESELEEIKRTLELIFRGAGITFGEFNVEMYYTGEHELFVIEINARQGGNNIPGMIEKHCGIDMYHLLVTTAMGHDYYLSKITPPQVDINTYLNTLFSLTQQESIRDFSFRLR